MYHSDKLVSDITISISCNIIPIRLHSHPTMISTTTRIKPCFSSPLTLLSWNIAMAQPSASSSSRSAQESEHLIREECLRHNPDLIALQESPYQSWGSDVFDGYFSVGTQQSHCGYVDLLVRHDLAEECKAIALDRRLPSIAASIVLSNKAKIAVSSSHLAPFKEGFSQRAQQCNSLMRSLVEECKNCMLLGDFNMRAAEDEYIESLCGGWKDAWKDSGSEITSKFTWDSFVNHFHEGGFRFKARFDRCYIKGDNLTLKHFGLIKGPGGSGRGDYLSDHFGMLIRVDVDEPTTEEY